MAGYHGLFVIRPFTDVVFSTLVVMASEVCMFAVVMMSCTCGHFWCDCMDNSKDKPNTAAVSSGNRRHCCVDQPCCSAHTHTHTYTHTHTHTLLETLQEVSYMPFTRSNIHVSGKCLNVYSTIPFTWHLCVFYNSVSYFTWHLFAFYNSVC